MGKEDADIQVLLQRLDSKIDSVSSEIQLVRSEIDKIQAKILIKLTSVIFITVGVAFVVNAWLFDHKIDYITGKQSDKIDKLDNAVFVPQSEQILEKMKVLQDQMDQVKTDKKTKKVKSKRR